jgi:hypothetical protein
MDFLCRTSCIVARTAMRIRCRTWRRQDFRRHILSNAWAIRFRRRTPKYRDWAGEFIDAMLIIDELGYVPLSQTAELMFEVFSQR